VTLAEVPVGRKAKVTAVDGTDSVSIRLLEMGILPGVEVEAVGTALFGDPMEFEVRGYRL
jgi:Fe2+ transport system protein FeoA